MSLGFLQLPLFIMLIIIIKYEVGKHLQRLEDYVPVNFRQVQPRKNIQEHEVKFIDIGLACHHNGII